MAYAEAIAHGLPVIGTTAGAIPETVPAGAGVLVPPDDVDALAAALRRLIENPRASADVSRKAPRRRGRALPSWEDAGGAVRATCWKTCHERLFRAVAGIARALRREGAQRRRARCGCCRRSGGQSSISVVDLACGTGATLRAIGARLPARQNWRLVDNNLSLLAQAAGLARPPLISVAATPDRSRARSRACARWSDRSGHHVGAARSRLGRMDRAPGGGSGGAPAAGLCRAHLSGARELRSGRAVRSGNASPPSTGISAATRVLARRSARKRGCER